MLIYAFTTQLENVGLRSRFIDGVVLEPGLQLDNLCAPIRALYNYVQLTEDMSVLFDRRVQAGINAIHRIMAAQRCPDTPLYETLLLPSGEPSVYPYVCYSNVLVWRTLLDAAWLYDRIRDVDRSDEANKLGGQVREAIWRHFLVDGPFGKMFAFSVDMEGNYKLGDDPYGSIQLLTHYGFCSPDDAVYGNTIRWIHSEHNPVLAPGSGGGTASAPARRNLPLVTVINDLLTGRKDEALEFLRRAGLDEGIACEFVDSDTGEVVGGPAFASGAGSLAHSLRIALGAGVPETATVRRKTRPSETLYEPPPEPSQDSRKARL
jgi:meiotically up-regulated gene 157 (Mug157) protein